MSRETGAGPAPRPPVRPGVRIGSVLGVPILIAPSWLLFAAFVTVSFGPNLAQTYGAGPGYGAAGGFAVLLLASVLLHEIGHCIVARSLDLPVKSITVTFLAGLTEVTEPPQTPAREYAVAVVGPMVSLLLAGLGYVLAQAFEPGGLARLICYFAAISNGLVAAFNLLPGLPLDGGRVLRAGVWRLTGDPDLSTVIAGWSGRVVALVVVPGLLLVVLPSIGVVELTLTSVLFAALIASFIYVGATATLRRQAFVERLPQASVAALSRPALTVPSDLPLSEAVRRAQAAGVHGVVLLDTAGTPVAVVSEAAVLATPETRRPWVDVSSVARRLVDGMVLDSSLEGERLLEAMRAVPASEYLVHDRGGFRVLASKDVAAAVTP